MILKIKAKIYRLTGIYLAEKEELEYITSKKFWKSFTKMALKNPNMRFQIVQGMLIGLWQCKHGFYRKLSYYERIKWKVQKWISRK